MSRILGIGGKKGSGKNTLNNFLHGYQLKALGKIENFDLDVEGRLVVDAKDENGALNSLLLDVGGRDIAFSEWAAYNMWPFVKQYSFASAVKEICTGLFNIPEHMIYGTDAQKNELTSYKWEQMPAKPKGKKGFMSSREFMQFFATEIMRKIYDNIWMDRTLRSIREEGSQLSIITDLRFENENTAIQATGGKTIYLLKSISDDLHASENGLDPSNCDAIIDNRNQTILETTKELITVLEGWGWMKAGE